MAIASRLTLDNTDELDRGSAHPRKAACGDDPALDGVGQDLCRVRQRQGKELSDVWLVLKIRPHHLIAIEEGRFDVLPARVYAIGYVRSYAAYLGLDAGTVGVCKPAR
jgi:cytoskeleton protein RodZ